MEKPPVDSPKPAKPKQKTARRLTAQERLMAAVDVPVTGAGVHASGDQHALSGTRGGRKKKNSGRSDNALRWKALEDNEEEIVSGDSEEILEPGAEEEIVGAGESGSNAFSQGRIFSRLSTDPGSEGTIVRNVRPSLPETVLDNPARTSQAYSDYLSQSVGAPPPAATPGFFGGASIPSVLTSSVGYVATASMLGSTVANQIASSSASTTTSTQNGVTSIKSFSVSATGAQNGWLNAGDQITVSAALDGVVTVVGSPYLALNIGGSGAHYALYDAASSNTTTLVFKYTVIAPDADTNGISIDSTSLNLGGGSITDNWGLPLILKTPTVSDNANYKVDTTAPGAPVLQASLGSEVTGTGEPGASIAITNSSGTTVGSGTVDSSGNFKITLSSPQAAGSVLTVKVTDPAGNVGAAESLTVGSAAVSIGALSADTGVSSTDFLTKTATQTISGTISGTVDSATQKVQVSVDGGTTWIDGTITGSSSPWSWTVDNVTLKPDASNQKIKARLYSTTDKAEVAGSSSNHSYTLDTTGPSAMTESLLGDTGSSASDRLTTNPSIQVTGLETGASWSFQEDGGTAVAGSGSTFLASSGVHTYTVTQTDTAGNIGVVSAGLVVTMDTTAPSAPTLALTTDTGSSQTDAITNLLTLSVGGLETGSTWQYQTDGGSWVNGSASSFVGKSGVHSYTVRQTDSAGNVSAAGVNFVATLDTTAPSAPICQPSAGNEVIGTAEAGSTVVVTKSDGTVLGTGTADLSGNFIVALSPVQTSGTLTIKSTDVAGNTGTSTSLPVSGTAITITAISEDSGQFNNDFTTNVTSQTITGTISGAIGEGSLVQISYDSGNSWKDATLTGSGSSYTWSYTGAELVKDASGQQILVWLLDSDFNVVSSTAHAYSVDTVGPKAPSLFLASDTGSSSTDKISSNPTLVISSLESGASWFYQMDGQSPVAGSGSTFVGTDGVHTYTVYQVDLAGNTGTVSSGFVMTLDLKAPDAPVLGLSNDAGISGSDKLTNDAGVTVSGLEGGGKWQYQVDGSSTWINGTASTFTASSGLHTYVVRQTDASGNVGTVSSALVVTLDTSAPSNAPTLSLASDAGGSVADGISNNGTIVLLGLESGSSWSYEEDGNGRWITGSGTALVAQSGVHTYRVIQTDAAGNPSATSTAFVVTLDTSPPEAPVLQPSAGSQVQGVTEPFGVVEVSAGSTILGSAVADAAGNFTVKFSSVQTSGTALSIKTTDVAGNKSVSSSFTVVSAAVTIKTLSADTGSLSSDFVTHTASQSVTGTVSGTVLSTDTVQMSVDGGVTWSSGFALTGPDSSGFYSWTATGITLEAGTGKTLEARLVHSDGTAVADSLTSHEYTLDKSVVVATLALASDSGSSQTDAVTTNVTLKVSGLEAGGSWQYQMDNGSWNTGTGSTLLMEAGTHTYNVIQTDIAGNVSSATSPLVVTIDTVVPAKAALALATDSGSSSTDKLSRYGTIKVSSLESGAVWSYQEDGAGVWVTGTGSTFVASSGIHTYAVKQTDIAGNVSIVSSNLTLTVDSTAPIAPTLSLSSDSGTSTTDLITNAGNISVSGLESGSTWQYQVDGLTWVTGSGSSFAMTSGFHSYLVAQTDAAGNITTSPSFVATLDSSAPSAPIVEPSAGTMVYGIAEPGSTVVITNSSGVQLGKSTADSQGDFVVTLDPVQQKGTVLTVKATDLAGNNSVTSSTTVTSVAVSITGFSDDTGALTGDFVTKTQNQTITGKVLGGVFSGDKVQVSVDGGVTWSTGLTLTQSADGSYSWTSGSLSLKSGSGQQLKARLVDSNGTEVSGSTCTLTYLWDTSAPTKPVLGLVTDTGSNALDTLTNYEKVTVSGLELGSSWQYQVDGGSTWLNGTGSTFAAMSGLHTYAVRQTDLAGNVGDVSTSLVLTLDSSAPGDVVLMLESDAGVSQNDQVSNLGTVLISGLESGGSWSYQVDGATAIAGAGSSFVAKSGVHSYTVIQTDAAGNIHTASSHFLVTLDSSLPVVPTLVLSSDTGSSLSDKITTNPTLQIKGLETGAAWSYQMDGGSWVEGTGTSFVGSSGIHAYLVRQTDQAGNISTTGNSFTVTLDTTAPVAPTLQTCSGTTMTGVAEANSTVVVMDSTGTTELGRATADAAGNFKVTLDPVQATGASLKVKVFDLAGNEGTAASTSVVATAVTIGSLSADSNIAGDFVTTTASQTVTGTVSGVVSSTDKVRISVDAGATYVEVTPTLSGGVYSWSTALTLKTGADTLKAWLVHQDGTTVNGSTTSRAYSVDATAPSAPTLGLSSDAGVSSTDYLTYLPTIMVAGLEAGASWKYQVDGGSWQTGSGTAFVASSGTATYKVKQIDVAGNESTVSSAFVVTLDTSVSALTLALANDAGISSSDRITFAETLNVQGLESGGSWEYQKDGGSWVSGTGSTFVASSGAHTYLARQTDAAGNVSTLLSGLVVTLDQTPVSQLTLALSTDTGISNFDYLTNSGQVQVSAIEAGANWQYQMDGGIWANGTGSSFMANSGVHTYLVRQSDLAGNVSTLSTSFVVTLDSTAPSSPVLQPSSGTLVQGTAEANSTVTVFLSDGTVLGTVTAGSGGDFSITLSQAQAVGTVLSVKATDAAGNVGSSSTTTVSDTAVGITGLSADTGVVGDFLTQTAAQTVSGTVTGSVLATDKVRVSVDGGTSNYVEATLTGSGSSYTWSASGVTLASGSGQSLKAWLVHSDGKEVSGGSSTHTYTLDTTAPIMPTLALKTDSGISTSDKLSSNPSILVSGLESNASWTYQMDGGTAVLGSGSVFVGSGGAHTYTVKQTDAAGNISTVSNALVVTLDITAPSALTLALATDTGISQSDLISTLGTLNVSGLESGNAWQYQIDSGAWVNGSGSALLAISGAHTYWVRQTDAAGNIGTVSSALMVTVDQTAPLAVGLSLATDTGLSTTDHLTSIGTITLSNLESGGSWQYQIDGAGSWFTGTGSTFVASSGLHTYTVKQTDAAGNVGTVSSALAVTLEQTGPLLALLKDTGSDTTDHLTSVGTITVSNLESAVSWQYQEDGSGSWQDGTGTTFVASSGLHTYLVIQTDAGGSVTTSSSALTVTVDQTVPVSGGLALSTDTGALFTDSLTNVGTVVVSGIESGGSWQYQIDGAGSWFTGTGSTFVASSGLHTYTVKQTDAAGNISTVSAGFAVTVDQSAPVSGGLALATDTGSLSTDSLTNIGTVVVSGIESGGSWQYQIDGAGSWFTGTGSTFVASSGLHTYTVKQTDAAGNISTKSSGLAVTVDETAPVSGGLALSTDTGSLSTDSLTNVGTVVVSGIESGGSWQYQEDGGTWVTGSGSTFVASSGLHTYTVAQTDAAGNISTVSAGFAVTVDQSAPVSGDLALATDAGAFSTDSLTNVGTVVVSGIESGGSWQYQIDGAGSWFTGTGTTFVASSGLHTYTVKQTDAAGNVSTVSPGLAVTLDQTVPTEAALALSTDTGALSTDSLTNVGTVVVSGIESGGSWQYQIDGVGDWFTGTGSTFVASSGLHTYTVAQTDAAGNISTMSSGLAVTVDETAPLAVGLSLAEDTGSDVTDHLTSIGTIVLSDLDSGGSWQYQEDGGDWVAGSGTAFVASNGLHTYVVIQTDAAGNIGVVSTALTVSVDQTIPVLALSVDTGSETTDHLTTIGTVVVTGIESAVSWQYQEDGSGSWQDGTGTTFVASSGLHTYVVRQTDADGNVSNESSGLAVTVDETAPVSGDLALATDAGSLSTDSLTNVGTVVISGLESGSSWQYQIDGAGSWFTGTGSTFVASSGLHTYTVAQTDAAGNISTVSPGLAVTLDQTAPTEAALALSTDTGALSTDSLTNVGTVVVSGIESGGSWQYQIDGAGDWFTGSGSTFVASSGLHTYTVVQTDAAGNVGVVSSGLAVTLDNTAPSVQSNAISSSPLNGSAYDVGETVLLNMNYDEAVFLDTTSGTPTLDIVVGTVTRQASYVSGSGTTALVFGYAVQFGDSDSDGVSIESTSALDLHGASLVDAAGNDATSTLPILSGSAGQNVVGISINLASVGQDQAGFLIEGAAAGEQSGYVVSSAGDVNGDGMTDMLIQSGGSSHDAYVVFGRDGNTATHLSDIASGASNDGFVISGLGAPLTGAWQSIGVVGDMNGDGLSDLALNSSDPDQRSYILFGKTGGDTVYATDLANSPASVGFAITGGGSSSSAGISGVGDVNGDGVADVLIGGEGGNSYVVFGQTGDAVPVDLQNLGERGFVLSGGDVQAGVTVAGIGDVNGDGLADMALGNNGSGTAYVVYGRTATSAIDLGNLANAGEGISILNDGGASFARSIAGAGDVNGDGYADLVVGSSDTGKAYVIFGDATLSNLDASNLGFLDGFTVSSPAETELAYRVSSAGDMNGDGLSDLLVSSYVSDPVLAGSTLADAGRSYVVYGKTSYGDINLQNLTPSDGFALNGAASGDWSGYGVSALGDVNGDGYADLLVAAPGADPDEGADAGRSYVVFGGSRFAGSAEFAGTSGADALTGTNSAETFVAGAGDDTITPSGADRVYAGLGDDVITIDPDMAAALGQAMVDGGGGIDTLQAVGTAFIDLTTYITTDVARLTPELHSRINSIERIDLRSESAGNALSLTAQDVADMSPNMNTFHDGTVFGGETLSGLGATVSRHQLLIDGTGQDYAFIGLENWTHAGTWTALSHTYDVYNANNAQVQILVDHEMVAAGTVI